MQFETNNYRIRQLTAKDAKAFCDLQGSEEVMIPCGAQIESPDEALNGLKQIIRQYNDPDNDKWIMAIEDRKQAFVGTFAFIINQDGEPEVGYRILTDYWNTGIASEVLQGCLSHISSNQQFPYVVAYVFADNLASIRVVEKAGFVLVKEWFNTELQLLDRKYQYTFTQ